MTELVIALAALQAGEYMLVKASIAGAIVTNSLFMLGASFFLGGLKFHVQEYNRIGARLQAGLLFLATVAMLIPSAYLEATPRAWLDLSEIECRPGYATLVAYGLGMLFSLKTHPRDCLRAPTQAEEGGGHGRSGWPWPRSPV